MRRTISASSHCSNFLWCNWCCIKMILPTLPWNRKMIFFSSYPISKCLTSMAPKIDLLVKIIPCNNQPNCSFKKKNQHFVDLNSANISYDKVFHTNWISSCEQPSSLWITTVVNHSYSYFFQFWIYLNWYKVDDAMANILS